MSSFKCSRQGRVLRKIRIYN